MIPATWFKQAPFILIVAIGLLTLIRWYQPAVFSPTIVILLWVVLALSLVKNIQA